MLEACTYMYIPTTTSQKTKRVRTKSLYDQRNYERTQA